ncbi:translocation/assembly module TamB domain-containing protein [Okeanomitos corallinicola TIOX110]|uniref:Translocation/assembly module TamB domain-containing protein n=1 Tax=Okeanomitos corallinicola TIOX110 TaxID=3133117 RepID=A0ABZ2URK7_9CYAN
MSNSSKQDSQTPTTSSQRLRLMLLSRGSMALVSLLLLLLVGSIWWLRNFIKTELAPLAQENLTKALNRPLKLGEVTGFSLTGVKFAASSIPATPTDTDRATIESIDVSFNPWQLVTNRQIKLDVTLINPEVYIEQDSQERWITTILEPPGKPGIIKTDLDTLRFRNAKLVLVGNEKTNINLPSDQSPVPVVYSNLYGKAQLVDNNQAVKFDVTGKGDSGGSVFIEGNLQAQATLDGDLQVKAQDLSAADVSRLIPLPAYLQTGQINSDLQVKLIPDQPTLLDGNAVLKGVNLQIPEVPQKLLNTQGSVKFAGLSLELENIVSNYGKIPLTAKGIIDREKGFDLTANVNAVSVTNALETLKVKSPLPVSGVVKADLKISGNIDEPMLSGQVTNIKPAKIDKVDFEQVSSRFTLTSRDSLITLKDIQGKTTLGGEVKGTGKIQLGKVPQMDVNLIAQNVPGDAIAKLYNDTINSTLKVGTVTATAKLSGAAENVQTVVRWQAPEATYPASGETIINPDQTVDFRNVAINVAGNIIRGYGSYNRQNWQAVAEASGVKIEPFLKPEQLENISLGNAAFNGKLVVSGTSEKFQVTNIRSEGAGINIGGGRVNIARLQLEDKNFVADLIANNVRLGRILKQSLPILNNPIAGKFTIAGNTENFDLKTLGAVGEGSLTVGNGKITAKNIQVGNGSYKAQVAVNNVPVQKLADIPPQLTGILAGDFNVAGAVDSFQPENIQATGNARLNLAGGIVTASNIQVADGKYQAVVNSSGVQLNRLNQQLQGKFTSQLQVAGILGSTKLADLRATGQVQFSRGIPGINTPLNAALAWNGQQLTIPQARTPNINASGYIVANAQQPGIPEITQLNLNVQAQNYDLKQLPFNLPNAVNVAGTADFKGQITGKPTSPNVVGALALKDLQVQKFAFEPLLTGEVNIVSGKGSNIDIAGKKDRLAATLNANNQPTAFLVQWQQALATGEAQGDNWNVKVNQFPLQVLNFNLPSNPVLGKGVLAGFLSGDLQFNQKTLDAKGNIAIAKPQLGRIKGDNFATQFSYNNNTATITDGKFTKDESSYILNAAVKQTSQGPQIQAKVNLDKANIQDLLTVAQIFEIQDLQRGLTPPTYGTAADLTTNPRGLPEQTLLNQIQRLAEIDALLLAEEEKRVEFQPIPDLRDLKGILNGEIALNTATKNGLAINFKLRGQDFTWGREEEPSRFYRADKLIAEGGFEKGILRLQPLRIEAKNRLIALTGNIGGEQQSGKLIVENFPIQLLDRFVKIPLGISGNLNINAGLAGSMANPKSRGNLEITEGTLNQKPIQLALAGFSYSDGRLQFGSEFKAAGIEPLAIKGDIPYKLPFASVEPSNNQIQLDAKIENENLRILNLLTDQIAFENGEGNIDIKVRGTIKKPLVEGVATLNNATFVAQALPGKLTNVSGKATFDLDKVILESLQAQFSDGKIEAAGEIPIFNNQPIPEEKQLAVSLEKLILNLKGLYQGGASGNLAITGSVLKPGIGGKIELSNGQVLLTESSASALSQNNPQSSILAANKQNKIPDVDSGTVRLNNLIIKLGKNVQIASPPVFNFLASGELDVTGSLNDPIPAGTIRLDKGGVNLFTTQFKLARSYKHTAIFRRSQPRDPELDVKLIAKVLDGTQTTDLNRQLSTGLSALETVRVEAIVKGSARQLDKNLELRTSPSRSQTEIVTLLGGGFIDTQGRGDSTLGLINIAGSAVFNNFQGAFNQIGDAFGLSELRIFPTILSDNPEAGKSNSTLELALEAGIDISNIFSLSTIKILTASDPFQWGINYRINDEFRIRASTNLTDDSRTVIEYERRF